MRVSKEVSLFKKMKQLKKMKEMKEEIEMRKFIDISVTTKLIKSMTTREFITYLNEVIALSPNDIINLYKEDIDGEAFLLLEKKDLSELGMMDKYVPLCNLFPMAEMIDNFFD